MKSGAAVLQISRRGLAVSLALLLASCATTPKIDWNSRLANYTYDQAVTELGPPDKREKLTEGSIVAEWLQRRGYVTHYSPPLIYSDPYHYYGWIYPGYYESYSPDHYLRLIFRPDGQLQSWKKFSK